MFTTELQEEFIRHNCTGRDKVLIGCWGKDIMPAQHDGLADTTLGREGLFQVTMALEVFNEKSERSQGKDSAHDT